MKRIDGGYDVIVPSGGGEKITDMLLTILKQNTI